MGKFLLIASLCLTLGAACATTAPRISAGNHPEGMPNDGRALYEKSCQRCHSLYMPRSFTAGEWKVLVRKYGRKARLSSGQRSQVLEYLTNHALPG